MRLKPFSWYTSRIITYIILIFFVFIALMPLLWMWIAAFRVADPSSPDPFAMPTGITFANIVKAWTVGRMGTYIGNSIIVAIPRVAIILLFSSMAGYGFGKLRWKFQNIIFGFILMGLMLPIQAMIIPVFYNLQRLGLVNTRWALIIPGFGMAMPFSCFMMRAFYRDLPNELLDSASIDGCNKFRIWLNIMAPLTKPALVSLLIFEFMWSWNDYFLPNIMIYSDNLRTMPLGLIFYRSKYTVDQTLIAAGVTLCTLPIIVVYTLLQKSFTAGITAGAIKG
jgi:ABC-type glycerol-3-phosphate transport system permease component